MRIQTKQLLLLVVLVLFGAFLRLYRFPSVPFSLFSDEVDIGYQTFSFRETGRDYFGNFLPLQFRSFSDVRTSLPIYATILVSYLPGVSLELAIRLTPLLYSVASLILIYFFINILFEHFGLLKKKGVFLPGHFAIILLALAPWHFTYSRTAFELSKLFFDTILGFYLFLRYLKSGRLLTLAVSLLVLGLTPMVYSTAKLAVFGYPIVLWLLTDSKQQKALLSRWYLLGLLFVPLLLLFINGGAGQRFSEIALHTDPTITTEVNWQRQTDLGPNPPVGSSPSLITKFVHNKLTYVADKFIRNLFTPFSATFLFVSGDPNLRHAVGKWGMLPHLYLVLFLYGLYYLFKNGLTRLSLLLLILAALAIIPSALTRDGADHSSRLYMLLLPLLILAAMGAVYLSRFRKTSLLVFGLLLIESFFYFHDYFTHYPYDADKFFHAGMKEVVTQAALERRLTVVSPKYEPPLIFYLFYNRYAPEKFQALLREKRLYRPIGEDLNLEGFQLGDEEIYFASVRNTNGQPLFPMKGIYYLTFLEAKAIYNDKLDSIEPAIKSPSGLPLFYRIEAN